MNKAEQAARLESPSKLARDMAKAYGEKFHMSDQEMEAALIALEILGIGDETSDIIEGLKDANAYAKGDETRGRVTVVKVGIPRLEDGTIDWETCATEAHKIADGTTSPKSWLYRGTIGEIYTRLFKAIYQAGRADMREEAAQVAGKKPRKVNGVEYYTMLQTEISEAIRNLK